MMVTASVGLLAYCAWWRARGTWDTTTSKHADRGTRFHNDGSLLSAPSKWQAGGSRRTGEESEQATAARSTMRTRTARPTSTRRLRSRGTPRPTRRMFDVIDRQYRRRRLGSAGRLTWSCATPTAWTSTTTRPAPARMRARSSALSGSWPRAYGVSTVRVAALEVSKSGVVEVCAETLDESAGVAGDCGRLGRRHGGA